MYLVLIETSGNQNYIFATNKLRENVGASELTYRVGTEWTLTAVKKNSGPDLWPTDGDSQELRKNLLHKQSPIEDEQTVVEVIVATSGKAILLVKDREVGKKIIQSVTTDALVKAPGLDVCGVISEAFEWNDCPLGVAFLRVHELFETARVARPGPAFRFQRLPVVAECASSGLPAKRWHITGEKDGIEDAARSAVTLVKWDNKQKYIDRMQRLLNQGQERLKFVKNIEKLEENTDWIAIVHADGNGLGQIFLDFAHYADCTDNRDYVSKLRQFSLGIDLCTERAFTNTLDKWLVDDPDVWFRIPLLPIVLGGDDMTVVCDGRAAIPFTRQFLLQFEAETGRTNDLATEDQPLYKIIQDAARKALGAPRLSSCAGISIIKPHYPFFGAYRLAEALIDSAKNDGVKKFVKNPDNGMPWPASALDFHIHYDTSGNDLDAIRRRLITPNGKALLYGRPYVVSEQQTLQEEMESFGARANDAIEWLNQHHWDDLQKRIDALTATDKEGRRILPNSQMHDLRAGLFTGTAAADARYRLIRHRYENDENIRISVFDGAAQDTLFEQRHGESLKPDEPTQLTKLLDALDVATLHDKRLAKAAKNGGKP